MFEMLTLACCAALTPGQMETQQTHFKSHI